MLTKICKHCKGNGFWRAKEEHAIDIPENFDGQNMEFEGMGNYIDRYRRGKLIVMFFDKESGEHLAGA